MDERGARYARLGVILAGGLALVLVPAAIRLRGGLYDDAWIHLRIAEHLVATGRPEFNPGDAVLSTSSLPWTLILAALVAVGLGNAGAVAALGATFTSVAAGFWAVAAASAVPERRAVGAGLAAGGLTAAFLFGPGAGGMEAPLALSLLGAAAVAWGQGRLPLAALLAGVAVAVRLELAVFLALVVVDAIRARRSAALAAAALGLGPFLLAEAWWFGTVVPHPVLAKRTVYEVGYGDVILLLARNLPAGGLAGLVEGAAWLLLAGAVLAVRTRGLALRLLAGALAVAGAYVALRQYVHPWYVANFEVAGAVGVVIALAREPRPVLLAIAGLAALSAVGGLALRLGLAVAAPQRASSSVRTAHVREGIAVGAWAAEALPGAVLATSEIGGLGRGFSGRVEDGMGLVTPGALRHHPMAVPEQRATGLIGAIPAAWVAELRPELVVGRSAFTRDLEGHPVAADYVLLDADLARRVGAPAAGSLEIRVRRDVLDALVHDRARDPDRTPVD